MGSEKPNFTGGLGQIFQIQVREDITDKRNCSKQSSMCQNQDVAFSVMVLTTNQWIVTKFKKWTKEERSYVKRDYVSIVQIVYC